MKTIVEIERKNGAIEFVEYATEEHAARQAMIFRGQGLYAWPVEADAILRDRDRRIEYAKVAMLNDRETYDHIDACIAYGAKDNLGYFAEMVTELVTEKYVRRISDIFPWCGIGYEHVCQALGQIVEEWEA